MLRRARGGYSLSHSRTLALSSAVALATLLATSSATAGPLMQPNGDTVPSGTALQGYLSAEGETYNVTDVCGIEPESFNPLCNLTFTVIARGGGQLNSFGWYNIKSDGTAPTFDDLNEFITCNDGVGTTKQLDIKSNPNYAGGQIGFFQATTQNAVGNCVAFNANGHGIADPSTLGYVYYSQPQFNPDTGYIHLLIMPSDVYPSAFYFGWEDLNGNISSFDNDFEDLLMRVSGLVCDGGGEACTVVGQQGLCAYGVTQCSGGTVSCAQKNQPAGEKCNNVDDDCDGQIDNGSDLCAGDPNGEICFQGRCVGGCANGEFVCPGGLTCDETANVCVDPLCVDKPCDSGTVCRAGVCVAPCDGVICPHGQECALGQCVDLCTGVPCDAGYACVGGVCKISCECSGCAMGETCVTTGAAPGICVDDACANLATPCEVGTVCINGTCVDACQGAVCPEGQICQQGECVVGSSAGGAAGNGGSAGGGFGAGGSGAVSGSSGAAGTAASSGSGGIGGTAGTAVLPGDDSGDGSASSSGCGCRVNERTSSTGVSAGLLALGLAIARRRSRAFAKSGYARADE